MKFLEFARARALSGHVPPKLRDYQLEWAMIDLEVRVENWNTFVTTRPDEAQEEKFMKENILKVSSPTSEQLIERYELYKNSWGLPNLSLADIQPYVESLARNYSTALERYANAEEDDLIKSTTLEHIGTADTTPASEAISGSSMQFSADQSNQAHPASSTTAASGLQQGGSEEAKQGTGVPPTGASSSKGGSAFVGSPFEQSIKNELSAFVGLFESLSVELATPAFICMLVLLALVLGSKDRIGALLVPLSRLARSSQTLQRSHWKAFGARLKSLFKLWFSFFFYFAKAYRSLYIFVHMSRRLSIIKQPTLSVVNDHLIEYPTPSNLSYLVESSIFSGSLHSIADTRSNFLCRVV